MANEKNIKKLTLAEMKKQVKKMDDKTKHTIKVGEVNYEVEIDNIFRKTKQFALLDDMVKFLNEGTQNQTLLNYATPYTALMLVKHFTDIDVSDDITEAIEVLNALIDLDVFNQVLNILPEDEVVKMYEILSATTKKMNDNVDEEIEKAEASNGELDIEIENDELREMLNNGEQL